MTTKQWMSRAWKIDREIEHLMLERDEEMSRLTSITQKITGDPVSGTKDPHKFDRIAELGAEIDREIDRLVAVKKEVRDVIDSLDKPVYRELLRRRYIEGERFEVIAVAINYSYKQTCRLHGRALIEVAEVLNGRAGT